MKYQREVFRNLTLIFQFGINMLVPILLCTFAGIFLDRLLGTSFIVIILFFLGAMAGFRNIYIFAKNSVRDTTHLGSDADAGISGRSGEDFAEKVDRVYRDNMDEQTEDHS